MSKKVFEGLNVADFSWVAAVPVLTKCLANFGATIVRMESSLRPDVLRHSAPYKDGIPGVNRSGYYGVFNPGKYSIALNLGSPKGLEVAKKLVAWADIVTENFTPGMMERWGLAYDDLRKVKPDIIMFRSGSRGQTGPQARQPGYGALLAATCGFTAITGWPDSLPSHPHGAHSDFIAARLGILAMLGALDYRRRTGKGQCLDMSQLEASVHMLSPLVVDYAVNNRVFQRKGNRAESACPHGAFRCRGEDRWCAFGASSDEEWTGLCHTLGDPDWTRDHRFASFLGRKNNEDELERLIEAWTIGREAQELMRALQAAGVPAGAVQDAREALEDPQMNSRGFFTPLEHKEMGRFAYHGFSFKLSKTPCRITSPSPCLGEHTEYVCKNILKMSDEEFVGLLSEGVFE